MANIDRSALEHIRRVVDSALAQPPVTAPFAGPADTASGLQLLPVPYVSHPLAANGPLNQDSAAACGVMLAQAYLGQALTLDEFYARLGSNMERPLNLQQISAALSALGVPVDVRTGAKLSDLISLLGGFKPVIALIKHEILYQAGLTPEQSDAPHFVVVLGADAGRLYIHDPFRQDASGEGQPLPMLTFYNAWTEISRDLSSPSLERAMIVPRAALKRYVSATTVVNIRGGAGMNFPVVGQTRVGEVFEIISTQGEWGQIGEGRWFSLTYARDI